MQFTPYIMFDGNCAEALKRYTEIFGGEIAFMQTFRGSPFEGDMLAEALDQVMHATLTVGNGTLMASDNPWGDYSPPKSISVSVPFDSLKEAKRVFDALAEGGEIKMEFQKTFWAEGFGMVVDRFGVPWLINCETSGD